MRGGEWPNRTKSHPVSTENHMRSSVCQPFLKLVANPNDEAFRVVQGGQSRDLSSMKTDQLVVVKDGQIIYEWYAEGFQADTLHCLWSASKTVTTTLLGAAIQAGKLGLTDLISKYYPANLRSQKNSKTEHFYNDIRVQDLMEMGANFKWRESYEDANAVTQSDVLAMVYGRGQSNMVNYALQAPMLEQGPGKRWVYSGGNSNLLLGILRRVDPSRYDRLPWELLFDRIGMKQVVFEKDGSGNFVGSSYVFSNPRDMARLGLLYLNNGVWDGHQILPTGWMSDSVQVAAPQKNVDTLDQKKYIMQEGVFGRTFWLNQPIKAKAQQFDIPIPFPHASQSVFFAAGHYGQWIIMFPELNMIVARTGHDDEYWSQLDDVFRFSKQCFSSYPSRTVALGAGRAKSGN